MKIPKNVPQSRHARFRVDGQERGVAGWHTDAEENLLIELARRLPNNGRIVEVGGEYGRSAAEFAFATKGSDIEIYTIDLFPLDHYFVGDLMEVYLYHLRACGLAQRVTPLRASSHDKVNAAEVGGGGINLLFIDANHTYNFVKTDIETWLPHVVDGGIIIFHDYAKDEKAHWTHLEVKRAVDDFVRMNKDYMTLGGMVDSTRWYTKNKTPKEWKPDVNKVEIKLGEPKEIISQKEAAKLMGLSGKEFRKLDIPKTTAKGRRNVYYRSVIEQAIRERDA